MRWIFLSAILALPGCMYVPERVQVSYQPTQQSHETPPLVWKKIGILVTDNRRDGKQVSCKKGNYGVELASIKLRGNLADAIENAIAAELNQFGYGVGEGDPVIEVEIQRFYNDFKRGFVKSRGVAELFLGVHVKKMDGAIVYSKNIIGLGENGNVWIQSGENAKIALESALTDAIHKLIKDQYFRQALHQ
jgi:uncharacterized lipoprotein YajG